MRRILFSLCISSGFLVSGCGGGGSSGGDGVASTPPPPMAVNSTLSDLKHSQTFINDATENKMVIAASLARASAIRRAPRTFRFDTTQRTRATL